MIWIPESREPAATDKLTYTSFANLGGRVVSLDEVRAELERLPLDMVLGVLSRLSALYLKHGGEFSDPRFQGEFLGPAIVDDFPCCLPGASSMYVPGRVPITGEKHLFIHEHNLCALTKLALACAKPGVVTERLTGDDYRRIARLLLIVNDHLSLDRTSGQVTSDLKKRREFAIETLYHGQFDHYMGDPRAAFAAFARLRILLIDFMPNAAQVAATFQAETGMSLELYFDFAALLLSHTMFVAEEVGPEKSPWMQADAWARSAVRNGDSLDKIVRDFTRSIVPSGTAPADEQDVDLFDLRELQERPFVEAREGELIVPVFSLLLRQLLSYPIVVLRRADGFLDALGESYQRYAHGLVVRIAQGNRTPLTARANERLAKGEIDSLLYGAGVAIVMEHKAKQVVATVGSINTARNALGPPDAELAAIATTTKPKDKGGVTQPIWQLRALAVEFEEHSVRSWNHRPTEVFPLVTLMESYRIDAWVRRGYLDPLIEASGTRFPTTWKAVEWMHVLDLEALAEMADRRELDLVPLLRDKARQPWIRFDMLLAQRYEGKIPLDQQLWSKAKALLDRAEHQLAGQQTPIVGAAEPSHQ